jgi:hypothetical protein
MHDVLVAASLAVTTEFRPNDSAASSADTTVVLATIATAYVSHRRVGMEMVFLFLELPIEL